jgi:hypothetical protein
MFEWVQLNVKASAMTLAALFNLNEEVRLGNPSFRARGKKDINSQQCMYKRNNLTRLLPNFTN